MPERVPEIDPLRHAFVVDETKHGKVYLLTGEGCVVAMRIRRRRGCVDEGLRRRRRRPLLVSCRGVRVMRRVVRRVMTEASCTTQKKTPVARRRRHIMMVVFVHRPEGFDALKIAKSEPNSRIYLFLAEIRILHVHVRGNQIPTIRYFRSVLYRSVKLRCLY